MVQFVHAFESGNKDLKDLLGGKGANLAEMTNLGIPVPPGFTISTEACLEHVRTGALAPELREQVAEAHDQLEGRLGLRFGDVAAVRGKISV